MASGGGGSSSGSQGSFPGTLSPVTASLIDLFGGRTRANMGQFQPTAFGGGVFDPSTFATLPGLLANQPLTGTEAFLLGAGGTAPTTRQVFDQEGFLRAVAAAQTPVQVGRGRSPLANLLASGFAGGGGGAATLPDPAQFLRTETVPGTQAFGQETGIQDLALASALQSQDILRQGAEALPALLETDPAAAIALARRGFTEETVPDILERAPGFSSSDLQRELTRAGVDLETNIAALREAQLGRVAETTLGLPAFAQALGGNLLDRTSDLLGFGQLGREFIREQTPAGDAFRVLAALQSLTGPSLTTQGFGSQESKQAQFGLGASR